MNRIYFFANTIVFFSECCLLIRRRHLIRIIRPRIRSRFCLNLDVFSQRSIFNVNNGGIMVPILSVLILPHQKVLILPRGPYSPTRGPYSPTPKMTFVFSEAYLYWLCVLTIGLGSPRRRIQFMLRSRGWCQPLPALWASPSDLGLNWIRLHGQQSKLKPFSAVFPIFFCNVFL